MKITIEHDNEEAEVFECDGLILGRVYRRGETGIEVSTRIEGVNYFEVCRGIGVMQHQAYVWYGNQLREVIHECDIK